MTKMALDACICTNSRRSRGNRITGFVCCRTVVICIRTFLVRPGRSQLGGCRGRKSRGYICLKYPDVPDCRRCLGRRPENYVEQICQAFRRESVVFRFPGIMKNLILQGMFDMNITDEFAVRILSCV
jgi:hypothetical protein